MPSTLPIGPYKEITVRNGFAAPFYMMPFDKKGRGKGPRTREHLIKDVTEVGYSNIFIFSHGWNNNWQDAVEYYESFIQNFQRVKPVSSSLDSPAYRPLLIGLAWPSISLLAYWERGPDILSVGPRNRPPQFNSQIDDQQKELDVVAEMLPDGDVETFYQIAESDDPMTERDAIILATMLAPLYAQVEDPADRSSGTPTPEELISFWRGPVMDAKNEMLGEMGFAIPEVAAAPAGIFDLLPDPRWAIRGLTVWKMKDRAGLVGATGVAQLLDDLLQAAPNAKIHLIGHSYGCKVLLSATSALQSQQRDITSLLLLQPAVNAYCFSPNVMGLGYSGGYHATLERIEQPILSTYSSGDWPLTKVFHLALRRSSDLGETQISNTPMPSKYAALGGFGPHGLAVGEYTSIDIKLVGENYPLAESTSEVIGIRSDNIINGHAKVVNEATAWALYCQVETAGISVSK